MQSIPIRILLAEDNPDHAELTIDVLNQNNIGNQVIHVMDGEEAIDYLHAAAAAEMPDLLLLDIKMPRVSGIEVVRLLKSDARYQHIHTVMLSTTDNVKEIEEAYSNGADSFVSKPINFESFMAIVSSLNYAWTRNP